MKQEYLLIALIVLCGILAIEGLVIICSIRAIEKKMPGQGYAVPTAAPAQQSMRNVPMQTMAQEQAVVKRNAGTSAGQVICTNCYRAIQRGSVSCPFCGTKDDRRA